jgi:hypothetical protein
MCRSAWASSGAGRRLGVEAGSTEGFFALAGEPREPAFGRLVLSCNVVPSRWQSRLPKRAFSNDP